MLIYAMEGRSDVSESFHPLFRRVAQLGRALRSGRRGRRFESCHADDKAMIRISSDK